MFIAHAGAFILNFFSKLFHNMSSGYLKVVIRNSSIFLYTMSILYLLYSYLLTRDLMDINLPETPDYDPVRHCLLRESTGNLQIYVNVH